MRPDFWKNYSLEQLTEEEWEALCDGCGKCCLVRLEDEDSGDIFDTDVHCLLFDNQKCQCTNYSNRFSFVSDCVKLTKANVGELGWLPKTCAYRLLNENRPLFDWHYLICGDKNKIHELGFSVKGKTIIETKVKVKYLPKHIKNWD